MAKKDKGEKTPKKEKTSKKKGDDEEDEDGGELRPVCAIAKPLADIKFHKKILKVVKKGTRHHSEPIPKSLPRAPRDCSLAPSIK